MRPTAVPMNLIESFPLCPERHLTPTSWRRGRGHRAFGYLTTTVNRAH